MAEFEVITVEHRGHVGIVWFDRPEARNAMGRVFWKELPQAMAEVSGDPEVRAVVIAGKGPHFSFGLDLKDAAGILSLDTSSSSVPASELSQAGRAVATRRDVLKLQESVSSVADCPKPVVAAVHGYCIGAGVDVISACDIRVASSDAVFSVRETRMAIVADLGSLQRLPGIIGTGHVAELAFTGKDISSERALQIGLINDVYPDQDALIAAALGLAEEIASNSPIAVQGTKAVLTKQRRQQVADGLEYVATWNASALHANDLIEAMVAFAEKRKPDFKGN